MNILKINGSQKDKIAQIFQTLLLTLDDIIRKFLPTKYLHYLDLQDKNYESITQYSVTARPSRSKQSSDIWQILNQRNKWTTPIEINYFPCTHTHTKENQYLSSFQTKLCV